MRVAFDTRTGPIVYYRLACGPGAELGRRQVEAAGNLAEEAENGEPVASGNLWKTSDWDS